MATSTQTYTKTDLEDLSVVPTFTSLMEAATSKDSLYIKAKESLMEYFDSPTNTLSEREKASMLVQLVSDMTTSITNSAMNTSVAIAKENREGAYQITKLVEDTKLIQEQADKLATDRDKVVADIANSEQDKDLKVIQGWKVQADMVRESGLNLNSMPAITSALLPATSINDSGIKYEQEQQTKIGVYATLAKSFRDSGLVTWTTDGTTGRVNSITDALPATPGLIKAQTNVAIRQEAGFDDNKLQHAANSSASFMGMLVSAEENEYITADDVALWRSAITSLTTPTP